jgi:hypothetical protein
MMQRFKSRIRKAGVNAYVDVPPSVSGALREYARGGRIPVEGLLNRWPIQATMMPAAGGTHRIYVNLGMRAGAGVDAGDRVTLAVRPTLGQVVAPGDVVSGLRAAGAKVAFDALSPSHRRELIRYIDAGKPEGRAKRIQKAAAHVLGQRLGASAASRSRPLWTCPKCGNQFVNKNTHHSCKRYRLEDVLGDKPPLIRELFDQFRAMVESCGPVTVQPYRRRIGFMVRVRFAGAVPKANWLDVGFWLPRRLAHPRFRKVETILPNAHLHVVRITRPEQLDRQLAAWIKQAYAVGRQEHLGPPD